MRLLAQDNLVRSDASAFRDASSSAVITDFALALLSLMRFDRVFESSSNCSSLIADLFRLSPSATAFPCAALVEESLPAHILTCDCLHFSKNANLTSCDLAAYPAFLMSVDAASCSGVLFATPSARRRFSRSILSARTSSGIASSFAIIATAPLRAISFLRTGSMMKIARLSDWFNHFGDFFAQVLQSTLYSQHLASSAVSNVRLTSMTSGSPTSFRIFFTKLLDVKYLTHRSVGSQPLANLTP